MKAPDDDGPISDEPQRRSILNALLAALVGEHKCAPPDNATRWTATSEDVAREPAPSNVYVCPECGQHLTRIAT